MSSPARFLDYSTKGNGQSYCTQTGPTIPQKDRWSLHVLPSPNLKRWCLVCIAPTLSWWWDEEIEIEPQRHMNLSGTTSGTQFSGDWEFNRSADQVYKVCVRFIWREIKQDGGLKSWVGFFVNLAIILGFPSCLSPFSFSEIYFDLKFYQQALFYLLCLSQHDKGKRRIFYFVKMVVSDREQKRNLPW